MPRKIDLLQEVYQTQLATLTYSREVWCSFLRTAAFQYKYSFPDQVLIWSQRPHARACAELELWNKVFDRWVNRHAKGIALIKDKGSYTGIRYVFDVADTHGRHGEELKLWQVRNGYHDDVTEALENRFGELEDDSSFVASVISACQNAVEDNMTDYLSDLSRLTGNSALEGMDEDNLKVRLRSILISSVAYTVLTRIGEESDMFLDFDAFDDLRFYNTAETINLLGNATRDISEVCLREIERTVKNCEKENRTFDEKRENEYNKTETEKQNHRQEEKEYGRIESDLPRGTERDAVSRPETAGADALSNRQVRRPAAPVPEGAQEGNLHNAADAVPAEQSSARDRADGEDDAFAPYAADGGEPWGERADESGESDALGAGDEQHQSIGGGDGSERPDLRISEKQPRNYLDGDDLIKILKHGDGLAHSKQDIVLFLSQEKDEERKNQYIRACYKPMTVSIYKDEAHTEYIGYSNLFDDGLHLFEGTYLNPKAEMSFSWQTTRELIEALIKDNNYLDEPMPETLATAPMETTAKEPEPEVEVKAEAPSPVKQNFAVSQEVIDGFLRLGGCTSRSNYRIYGFYRRANNKEENIRFLRAEYETDAIGLIVNGQRCAVAWDENGVTFATGESVATAWRKSTLSWSEIDDRIRQLIELGQYISKDEASSAVAVYDKSVAEKVTNVYRDFLRDAEFPEKPPQNDYQKQVIFFFAILHEPGRAEPFIPVFEKAVDALTGEARRREGYTPQFVKMLVSSYRRDPVEYPQEEYVLPPEHYLSQDQIDNHLIRSGNHISEGKFRIYSFFLQNKNKQERAKFLSDEYGIGGSYDGRQDESHDSKGLALAGGLDKNGVRNVLLSWAQVANRIDELIRSGRYLTAKEVEHLDAYEKEQIARRIVNFYYGKSAEAPRPFEKKDMLLITNDGRKAALDQRLLNPDLPDFEESKVNHCVRNVVDIWRRTADQKSAQLVFCDLSTPHHDGKFNVYDDIRKKLIEEGIPESEIAFIHDADTDAKKKDLFSKVRSGQVRVLMGSTFKMGAGTNVQERLIALHDLDVPWRPSDLEQRLGRIVRQGNSNPEVEIYRYVTEGTFDAYMYQLLESKQKFISQIMTSKSPVRCAEDVDDTALSYAEIKALASGNPKIMEKMQLDADVAKLKLQKSAHLSERYMLEDQLFKDFPKEVSEEEERIAGYGADIEIAKENTHKDEKGFSPMIVQGKEITVKAEAGKAILAFCKKMTNPDLRPLGEYRGFKTEIGFDIFGREFFMMLRGKLGHRVTLGQDANGIITRLDNALDSFFTKQCHCKERLSELKQQIENAKREVATPFPREEELTEKLKRLDELNAELNMDKPENELVDGEKDGDEIPSESKESRPENDRQERALDDDREEECR